MEKNLVSAKNQSRNAMVIIGVFLFSFFGRELLESFIPFKFTPSWWWKAYHYSWFCIPPLIAAGFLFGFKNLCNSLGLSGSFLTGFVFALITVSPMWIGSAMSGSLNADVALFVRSALLPGFFEEFLFRGFLFGLLFRYAGWGFIPSAMIGALIFGAGHLYQGSSIGESAAIFGITFMGALWFAWLFIEWDENLWIPIFLHIMMNASWSLFEVSETALGNPYSNIFRVATIALTVVITIVKNKQRKKFAINRTNLMVHRNVAG